MGNAKRKRQGHVCSHMLREKQDMRTVPKAVRQVWYREQPAQIDVPRGYRKKWTDDDTERVIRATSEEYSSYRELAMSIDPPRTSGAVRWRKDIAIRLLDQKPYALERALSGEHRYHDWAQVHRVLQERGYYHLPVSEQMRYARHLGMPSSSWRGDGTQAVLKDRKLNRLDTTAALRELIQDKLERVAAEDPAANAANEGEQT